MSIKEDLEKGRAFTEFDGGGMILDGESGDVVPTDQIIRDPVRVARLLFADLYGNDLYIFDPLESDENFHPEFLSD